MNRDSQNFYTFDILDGDALMELDAFAKLLWALVNEKDVSVLPQAPALSNSIEENDTVAELKYIYFIHYFNLLICNVLGHGLSKYRSFARKHIQDKNMKDMLTKKANIQDLLSKNVYNINLLNSIVRNYVSDLMENGVSSQRLDSSLDMHYLNAISVVVPNIRKNSELRNHIIPLIIEDASFYGKLKRFFGKQV